MAPNIRKRPSKRIGFVALVLIIIMAAVPTFITIGDSDGGGFMPQFLLFITGLVMTVAFSEWDFKRGNSSIDLKSILSESQAFVYGIGFGFGAIVVNGLVGKGGNLLLGGFLSDAGLYMVLLAGVAEELFFRGFIQNALSRFIGPLAILPAALIFTFYHYFRFGTELIPLLVIFGIGIVFGLAYELTGNIAVPMIAHCINNGAAELGSVVSLVADSAIILVVLAVLFVLAIIFGRASRGRR